ncbi:hypothetical protein, partial [Escherichia coli]|uniref:hypothetical protein n=1 Tax=Escherichia coli TaxID=562 RepID=UPI0035E3C126
SPPPEVPPQRQPAYAVGSPLRPASPPHARQALPAHRHGGGGWKRRKWRTVVQDKGGADRDGGRGIRKFITNALWPLRGVHPLFGNTCAGEAQHTPTAQAGDL